MRRLFALFLLLFVGGIASAANEQHAVIRIPSHGASATVIQTGPGTTYILGCAHAYEGTSRNKKMVFDIPSLHKSTPKNHESVLLAVDYKRDLSLVLLKDGPLDFVCPIAPKDWVPSANVHSIGYDEMKIPPQDKTATIVGDDGLRWLTKEMPWHGRSGGGLIDMTVGRLIGVVQGYETTGQRHGLYINTRTIWQFLEPRMGTAAPPPQSQSFPFPQQFPRPRPPCRT